MRVLSLDTTTRAGSVALVEDGRVVAEEGGDGARTHAERLPGELLTLLAAHAWPLNSIDLFAVASGPGSFTGLRIGIATIQGLAFAERRPVVAVSALEALGHVGSAGARAGDCVAAWVDARRAEVFSALYRVADAPPFDVHRLETIEEPTVDAPSVTLRRWSGQTSGATTFIGDGALLYRLVIEEEHDPGARIVRDMPMLAGTIGCMAIPLARAGRSTSPAGVQPQYVRRPDAEIDREKRAAAAHPSGG